MKKFVLTLTIFIAMTQLSSADNVKSPNVSGQFYSANPVQLSEDIARYFRNANVEIVGNPVEIIIAPHAGYIYSGGVAAYGYKAASKQQYKTIVILAPTHYFTFMTISIWPQGSFQTPLGSIPVDEDFAQALLKSNPKFKFAPEVFEREHSVEVELPFLQKTFKDFKIVPIIMGQMSAEFCKEVAEALNKVIGSRTDVLVVISTDMSHYHPDDVARGMDQKAIKAIEGLQAKEVWQQCRKGDIEFCGFIPVTTALYLAQLRGLTPKDLKYGNSGDITFDKHSVVGYTSAIFYKDLNAPPVPVQKEEKAVNTSSNFTKEQQKRLLDIAKKSMVQYVKTGKVLDFIEQDKRLQEKEGAFVTIHKGGALRGCIGNIISDKPLYLTVRNMAVAAASQDPRFKPVMAEELENLELEISVLSQPRVAKDISEFKPGVHGAILSQGLNQGVFLPQVATETGWNSEEFFSNLCAQKAGLPPDCWKDPKTKIQLFTADVFSEKDVQ